MTTIEIQKELIEKIQSTMDDGILEEVSKILNLHTISFDQIVLTDFQRSKIDAGLKDIIEGNFIAHEEAEKEMEEWLKE